MLGLTEENSGFKKIFDEQIKESQDVETNEDHRNITPCLTMCLHHVVTKQQNLTLEPQHFNF